MVVPVGCEQNLQISMLMSMDLDGVLDPESQGELRQHVAACPACLAQWTAMQQVSALLENSGFAGPPLGFSVRVERRLEENARRRQRTFRGLALLTGSLSLAGITLVATAVLVVALLVCLWPGSQSARQQVASLVSQLASWVGLMGKGMTLFLGDLFLQYGVPMLLLAGTGLAVLSVVWAWLYTRRPRSRVVNGQ